MRDGVRLRSEVLRVARRVPWDMPVWPVWQLTGWVVDPHYLVRLQTFRQRAAEVSLVWRDDTSSVREVVPRMHEGRRSELAQRRAQPAANRANKHGWPTSGCSTDAGWQKPREGAHIPVVPGVTQLLPHGRYQSPGF